MFGESLSKSLNIPFVENVLVQKTASAAKQASKRRFDRWENVASSFHLSDTNSFEGKHVLLIDDVITTGATLEACTAELLKSKDTKVSIATMAFTEYQ